ncbi:YjbF family lipoprotein [Vibrio sp. ZSDE26]|uniref:YjbF family lipoprotein n=1 Tax=Vibrio amylolyticus TaxID=2847292 RepID=A0A9X1XHS7_9VIBR|nr:YjbF family lipoprotein [Vibrio amylolyticus]MCK6263189.1 YjbF family lipoprotein [Vibrio amylolyticus]
MKIALRLITLLPFTFLLGCTQNAQDLSDSFSLALFGHNSPTLTQENVNSIPYASKIIEYGDNSKALIVLAWVEAGSNDAPNTLKWLSASNEMVVTQAGRITKTANFPNSNLIALQSEKRDPLARGLHLSTTPHHWSYTISWHPGYHIQYEAQSRFKVLGEVEKQLPFETKTLLHIEEVVSIPVIEYQSSNHYWLDPESGKVIASEQTIIPNGVTIKLSTGKSYQQEVIQ